MALCPFCSKETVIRGMMTCPNPDCDKDLSDFWAETDSSPPASEEEDRPAADAFLGSDESDLPDSDVPKRETVETESEQNSQDAALSAPPSGPDVAEKAPGNFQAGPLAKPVAAPRQDVGDAVGPVCPHCEEPVDASASFCNHCGGKIVSACPNPTCGKDNRFGASFCAFCGTSFDGGARPPTAEGVQPPPPPPVETPQPPAQKSGTSLLPPFIPHPASAAEKRRSEESAPVHLVVLNPDGSERCRFALKNGTNQIGALSPAEGVHPDVDLSMAEAPGRAVISRQHAVLQIEESGIMLTDLGSTNGTTVNKQKLAPNNPTNIDENSDILFANITCRIRR